MGVNETGYEIVKSLHILAAIIGFGAVMLNGLYGRAMEQKKGPEAAFMGKTVERVGHVAEYFIYAVPILGFLALWLSDGVFDLGQTWVWLSILLYVVGIAISHTQLFPNVRRMNELMDELAAMGPPPPGAPAGGPPPQAIELEQRGKRMPMIEGPLNLLVVIVVFLMVFKPGL